MVSAQRRMRTLRPNGRRCTTRCSGSALGEAPASAKIAPSRKRASSGSEAIQEVNLAQNGELRPKSASRVGTARPITRTRLQNPDRLVLDFAGSQLTTSEKHIASNLDPVREIRLAQFTPEVSRVVIDLRSACAVQHQCHGQRGNGLRLPRRAPQRRREVHCLAAAPQACRCHHDRRSAAPAAPSRNVSSGSRPCCASAIRLQASAASRSRTAPLAAAACSGKRSAASAPITAAAVAPAESRSTGCSRNQPARPSAARRRLLRQRRAPRRLRRAARRPASIPANRFR